MISKASSRPWFASKIGWYVILAALPILGGLVFFTFYVVRDRTASAAVKAQIAQWQREGVPYDNASMLASYRKRTRPEGTEDWTHVLELVQWNLSADLMDKLPYLGSSGVALPALDPDAAWPEEPLIRDYLNEMQPVLTLIEKACQHPKPVRFSGAINGVQTTFEHQQNSRTIIRLLQLSFDHAYFHRDTKKAMKYLELMESTADAFDSKEALVTEMINSTLRGIRLQTIQRSLTACIWNDEELERLRVSLARPHKPSDGWKEIIEGERAFSLSIIGNADGLNQLGQDSVGFSQLFPLSSVGLKEFVDLYSSLQNLSMEDWRDANSLGKRLELDIQKAARHSAEAGVWMNMLMPATGAIIQSRIRLEETRRWVLTAVAIRQFKNKFGRWPVGLRDLEQIGLTSNDYSIVTQQAFGYEVENDRAYLWTITTWHSEAIREKRPRLDDYAEPEGEAAKDALASIVIELQ